MRTRVTVVLAAAMSLGAVNIAAAADMPAKAPVYPAPMVAPYSWTGFYAGLNVGYGWGSGSDPDRSVIETSATGLTAFFNAGGFPISAVNPKGVIGGGQIGYNWQLNSVVLGVVADFQGSGMKDDGTFTASPPTFVTGTTTLDRKIDWFGTVRGKLGWASQNWLLYATGGLAYGHIKEDLNFTSSGTPRASGSHTETKAGWTVGGGLEYGWSRWSLGVEYLYIDLGSTDATMTFSGYPGAGGDSVTISSHNNINVVRALVNYRF